MAGKRSKTGVSNTVNINKTNWLGRAKEGGQMAGKWRKTGRRMAGKWRVVAGKRFEEKSGSKKRAIGSSSSSSSRN
jgi:hypothetical protein